MEVVNVETWERKQHFEHFKKMHDPFFGVTIPFDVTKAYQFSKTNKLSFFGRYLHDCMRAINAIDALKLRILDDEAVKYTTIHASTTILRPNKTFGFSFVEFDEDLHSFLNNLTREKKRIESSQELFPPKNGLDCVHCSALPWLHFSGHKEPVSGVGDSIPKLAFSKIETIHKDKILINVAINVNHALVDGYHLGLFSEKFQHYLNS